MNLNNIVIILVHPDESRNIGAACRAMANNDISELRIVGKKADYDIEHIHTLAIHAGKIFDEAKFYDSITAATADCAICAGTTRRRGKKRGRLLLPEEFADMADRITEERFCDDGEARSYAGTMEAAAQAGTPPQAATAEGAVAVGTAEGAADGTAEGAAADTAARMFDTEGSVSHKVAVIFGNERTGLTDGELDECNVGVTIPSSENFGSLNLSHAVQVMCYHLFRKKLASEHRQSQSYTPLPLSRIDKTVQSITDDMKKVGFFKMPGREDMENFWRSILSRAAISEGEAQYLEKTFSKIAGLSLAQKKDI